ncbi:hypothetical protein BC832DRAFT_563284 [Gaertneriomyces semiglobifer]|nr:hypothetical protein BC832DRAFT_563284 [Gaertneriomyces semiglobifer]
MILAGTQKMTLGDSGMGEEGKGSGGGEDAETRTSGPDSGSEHNGRGNSVTGEVVKGVHYPLGTECCDDLEWDDPDFDHTRPRPIIRPSYHVRIPGVTDSLGTEGPDDVEWDDDNFKIDARRSAPAISNSTARRVIYDNQYQCVCEVGLFYTARDHQAAVGGH